MSAQPFDALTALLDWRGPEGTDAVLDVPAVLAALDELTGGAAHYPLIPREDLPETLRLRARGPLVVAGPDAALGQALLVGWFLGVDVHLVTARPEPWRRLRAEAVARGLAVPGLETHAPEAAPAGTTRLTPLRWRDVGVASWARALLEAEPLPGTVHVHRGEGLEPRLDARRRLLVELTRRDPDFRPRLAATAAGEVPTQSKADLEQMTAGGSPDGQVLRSGASTGAARFITYGRGDWARMVAEAVPMLYAVGLRPGDVVVNTLFGGSLYGGLTTSLCELSRMGVLNLTTGQHVTPEELVAHWRRFGVTALVGMPTLLLPLLRDALALEPDLRLETVVFGGSALADHDRDWLREALGVRTLSSILAANDGAQIAYQCPHQSGRVHHLVDDYNLVEVVDEEGRACPDGVAGEILLTTLQKLHQPLLRYRIGDLGALGRTRCACGVEGRTLEYLGRADDLIKVKARTVTHREIAGALARWGAAPVQVVVESVDGTESVRVRAEVAAPDVDAEELRAHLAGRFEALADRTHFGGDRDVFRLTVDVLPPGALERHPVSGKVRTVIDRRLDARTLTGAPR